MAAVVVTRSSQTPAFPRCLTASSHLTELHRPLSTIVGLLKCFLHTYRGLQCGKCHTQVPETALHGAFNSHFPQSHTPLCVSQTAIVRRCGRGFHLHQVSQCKGLSALAFQDTSRQTELSGSVQTSKEGSDRAPTLQHENTSGSEAVHTPVCSESATLENGEKDVRDADAEKKQDEVVQESVEILEARLKELETSVLDEDPKIGALSLRLAQLYILRDEDPEKILLYGQRALKSLSTPDISLECATCLEVIGCACHKKGESEKAVTYLERAAFILDELEASDKEEEMGRLQFTVQTLLGQAKMSLGREGDALVNFQQALAIDERVLDSHNPNVGKCYHHIAEAFMQVQDLHEALALCLKALPIYTKCYGSTSLQLAELRKLMSLIHYGLDNFENVLSAHQIVRPIFEAHGKSEEVASLDLAAGEALLCLDRYTDAISQLKDVVEQTTSANPCHGQALVLLAKAYAYSEKEKSAKTYCQEALKVLRNKEPSIKAGASSVELALVFRQLDETEQALSTFKTSLEIYQKYPSEQAAVDFIKGQIGLLLLSLGKTYEALPYLEACLANDEGVLGLKSKELLDVYNQLGAAYIELGKLDEALAKFEAGRVVAEYSNVSKDPGLITLYHNLASVYIDLGRLGEALKCQKLVVKMMKKTGSGSEISLEDAERKLAALLQEADECMRSSKKQD